MIKVNKKMKTAFKYILIVIFIRLYFAISVTISEWSLLLSGRSIIDVFLVTLIPIFVLSILLVRGIKNKNIVKTFIFSFLIIIEIIAYFI